MRNLIVACLCVAGAAWSQPRGVIDSAAFKQAGDRAAVQFGWRFEGRVQVAEPVFRGFLLCRVPDADEPTLLTGGEENPETASAELARRSRVAPKGAGRVLFEGVPENAKLIDYRIELWMNGQLTGHRHGARLSPEALEAQGVRTTWWLPGAEEVNAALQAQIRAGTERATAWLLEQQKQDGHWVGNEGEPGGYTAFAALALVKSGTPVDAPGIEKALRYLKIHKPFTTYELACTLMLLEAVDPEAHQAWMKQLAATLVRRQSNGTWSYDAGNGDLSNTQYGALGLWSAQRVGIEIDSEVWKELGEACLRFGNADGSFHYEMRGLPEGTLPMSAAGAGTAMICHRLLADGATERLRAKLAEAGVKGWKAMAELFDEEATGYSLYGTERVAALVNQDLLGQHDWYLDGARLFLRRQEASGRIDEELGGPVAGTAFALLFWKRSTRTAVDPDYDPDAWMKEDAVASPEEPAGPVDPVTADFDRRFPMVQPGEPATLKSTDGRALTGTVVRLEAGAVVLEVNGRSGTIPFTRLDKTSRVRVDAAFREQVIEARRAP